MGRYKTGKLGQGATEYLILLAVVLIVALASIALLGFFPGMSADTQLAESKAYWSGAARPFQVLDAASTYGLCGNAAAGGYVLSMQNTEISTLTITNISVDGSSGFCISGAAAPNAPVSLGPGERKALSVITSASASPCTEGKVAQMNLNITYSTGYLPNKVQSGTKKLALRCSTPAVNVTQAVCSNAGQDCSGTSCCSGLLCNQNDEVCYSCLPQDGYTCGSNSDCCSGLVCNDGACTPPPCTPLNGDCSLGQTCCNRLTCSQGVCVASCMPSGASCSRLSLCCNGICNQITSRCP